MASLEELEKRLQVLEDVEAIRQLKARYGQLCDDRFTLDPVEDRAKLESIAAQIASFFTEDAVFDGGALSGVLKGRQSLMDYYLRPNYKFGRHYFVKPDITVEGNKARARWLVWMPVTTRKGSNVCFVSTTDDEYTKVNGRWLQSRVKLTFTDWRMVSEASSGIA